MARLGEEAGGFEQAEAIVVHGVLVEDEEDEHVPDEGCTRRGSMVLGTALRGIPGATRKDLRPRVIGPRSDRDRTEIGPRSELGPRSTSDRG